MPTHSITMEISNDPTSTPNKRKGMVSMLQNKARALGLLMLGRGGGIAHGCASSGGLAARVQRLHPGRGPHRARGIQQNPQARAALAGRNCDAVPPLTGFGVALAHVSGQLLQIFGMTSSGSGAGSGMRTFQRLPPWMSAKHWPWASRLTTCDGSIIGTLDMLMRSCVFDVKSVVPRMSELPVAPLTTVVVV